jgi:hypothetical protein
MLIYVVLQANPEHLVSNVQYILRFRNQEKLGGEAGYYLSSLVRRSAMLYFCLANGRRWAPSSSSRTWTGQP